MVSVFEHVDNPYVVSDALYKILRPGGFLINSTPFLFPHHPSPEDNFRYSPEALRKIHTQSGFEWLEGDFHINYSSKQGNRRYQPGQLRSAAGHHGLLRPLSQTHKRRIVVTADMDSFRHRKILITGGLGFIGTNLAIRLVEAGAEVTVVDSLIPEYGGNLWNIELVKDRIGINISDVRDEHSMKYLIQNQDYLFNLAGQTSPSRFHDRSLHRS